VSGILVDQGTADSLLEGELKPELLEVACATSGIPLTLRRRDGHDHSHYFIASLMAEHVAWHARRLGPGEAGGGAGGRS
jgi:S-formylglutathione hydrolase